MGEDGALSNLRGRQGACRKWEAGSLLTPKAVGEARGEGKAALFSAYCTNPALQQ